MGFVPWSRIQFRLHVSFTPEETAEGKAYYNYKVQPIDVSDEVEISVFYKNDRGEVFHTPSCYERGIDIVNGAYQFLDLVPKGRDEESSTGQWRGYDDTKNIDPAPSLVYRQPGDWPVLNQLRKPASCSRLPAD